MGRKLKRVFSYVSFVISVILACMLVMNVFAIARSKIFKNDLPTFFGCSSFLVKSEEIRDKSGDTDYVIVKKIKDDNNLKYGETGDIIAFEYQNSFIVARLVSINTYSNQKCYNLATYDKKYNYSKINSESIIGKSILVIHNFGKVIVFEKNNHNVLLWIFTLFELLIIALLLKNNYFKKGDKNYE